MNVALTVAKCSKPKLNSRDEFDVRVEGHEKDLDFTVEPTYLILFGCTGEIV